MASRYRKNLHLQAHAKDPRHVSIELLTVARQTVDAIDRLVPTRSVLECHVQYASGRCNGLVLRRKVNGVLVWEASEMDVAVS
jgi:hypothetical protein